MEFWSSRGVLPHLCAAVAFCVFFPATSLAQDQAASTVTDSVPHRVKVAEDLASTLVVQKTAIQYPEVARKAGTQGLVVLDVVVGDKGDVKAVTVASGDFDLAQGAIDSVKRWKYRPYVVDGSPVEMETTVSINFHLKSAPLPGSPPLGGFGAGNYTNKYFDLSYPLSRDWVRETDLMRKNYGAEGLSKAVYVLLAAVHIPEHTAPPKADSSFVLSALERSADASTQTCDMYLQTLASELQSKKEAQQKGAVSSFTVAGHDFSRADFEFRHGPSHHAIVCAQVKDYLLQWNVAGSSRDAVQGAVNTITSITAVPPVLPASPPTYLQLASGVAQGLRIKNVSPIYPEEAKFRHIQGTVELKAVINKAGDVADLEVIDGPIELVVSAVNAVRQWKFRPYVLNGEPVAVEGKIIVQYQL